MTHDELLAKIDEPDHWFKPFLDIRQALRAVVELHKPATANSFTNNDCICMLPNKKCATIQAIEKELNGQT